LGQFLSYEKNCCENGSWNVFTTLHFLHNL
jgi:hypothetical protein